MANCNTIYARITLTFMFQKFIQVGLYLRGRYNTGKGVAYIRDVKWVTYFWGVYSWGLMYRGRINRILRYIYIYIYIYIYRHIYIQ